MKRSTSVLFGPDARPSVLMTGAVTLAVWLLTGTETAAASAVEQTHNGPFELLDIRLPGPVVDWAVQHRAAAEDRIFLLVGEPPEEAGAAAQQGEAEGEVTIGGEGLSVDLDPERAATEYDQRSLFVFIPARLELTEVETTLPSGARRLDVADLDGNGDDDVLLETRDALFVLAGTEGAGMSLESLSIDPGAAAPPRLDRRPPVARPLNAGLPQHQLGQLALLNRHGLAKTLETPRRAERTAHGFVIFSPPVTATDEDGQLAALVGPEAAGDRRVRVTRHGGSAGADAQPLEMWGSLPGPESLEDHEFFYLDNRLRLMVLTQSSDKLGVFERRRVRVFDLEDDRSRSGSQPLLLHQTVSYRWQQPLATIVDIDRDGGDDLLLLEPDGLASGKLAVHAFYGDGKGGFSGRQAGARVDRPGDSARLAPNLLGDDQIQLVVAEAGQLLLFPLAPSGPKLFSKDPAYVLVGSRDGEKRGRKLARTAGALDFSKGAGTGFNRPHVVDLESDGRSELLFLADGEGLSRVRLLTSTTDSRWPGLLAVRSRSATQLEIVD